MSTPGPDPIPGRGAGRDLRDVWPEIRGGPSAAFPCEDGLWKNRALALNEAARLYNASGGSRILRNTQRYSSTFLQGRVYEALYPGVIAGRRTVLDLGCGDGRGIRWALEGGAELVVGVDIVEEPLRWCMAQTAQRPAHFILSDLRSLQFEEQSFDLITAFESIYLLGDEYEATVAQYGRFLAEDGRFVTSDPSWEGALIYAICSRDIEAVRSVVRENLRTEINGGERHRARCFIDGEIERIFERAGMALERKEPLPLVPALMTRAFPRDSLPEADRDDLVRMIEGLLDGRLRVPKNHVYVFRRAA